MEAHRDDRGIAATWLAVVFLFLMAAMALGADTAAFFRSAGVDQTVADLACLAGVQELPAAPQRALLVAGENVKANFPRIASAIPVLTVDQSILSLGENVITINTNWSGDLNKMRVHMTSSEARGFSHIWSSSDVLVTQEAICAATPAHVGPGLLPIGATPGGFTGTLDACTDSGSTAACGTLDVGTGSDWRNAVAIARFCS